MPAVPPVLGVAMSGKGFHELKRPGWSPSSPHGPGVTQGQVERQEWTEASPWGRGQPL